jgi:hypothetical protein
MARGRRGQQWLAALIGTLIFTATGCGELTIRTWITVDEAQSGGFVQLDPPNGDPRPVNRLQGGFLAAVTLDTTQLLDLPIHGTITIEDVRLAGQTSAFGKLCTWANPAAASEGTLELDLVHGVGTADLSLDILAVTSLSASLPPANLVQDVTFELNGLTLQSLLDAAIDGSADGLFATEAAFEGESEILGVPVLFSLDLTVGNGPKPPLFSADHLTFCNRFFEQQGQELFHSLNSKSSYLQAQKNDSPQPPIVIALADIGARPGDLLRLERVGTYADETLLKDGRDKSLTGVFSATNVVGAPNIKNRVPGAIDAGPDVNTGYLKCLIFPLCVFQSTNIPQDFRIDETLDVVVPAGAAYLIVAPLPPAYTWEDNSGFGFGVDVTVNP